MLGNILNKSLLSGYPLDRKAEIQDLIKFNKSMIAALLLIIDLCVHDKIFKL